MPWPVSRSAAVSFGADEQADYLVITDRRLAAGAQRLAEHRANNGLQTRVVYLDEIANQTNHGMASPHNIRAFLDWAQTNWGVRYAVSAWMRQIYKVTGDIYLPLP